MEVDNLDAVFEQLNTIAGLMPGGSPKLMEIKIVVHIMYCGKKQDKTMSFLGMNYHWTP